MGRLPPTCFVKAKHIKPLGHCGSPGHQARLVLATAGQSLVPGDNCKVFIGPSEPEPHKKTASYALSCQPREAISVLRYLHVSKPLSRASLTCAFEAMLTPREPHTLRASEALKAYWGWWRPLQWLTRNTPATLWFSAGKTGTNIPKNPDLKKSPGSEGG